MSIDCKQDGGEGQTPEIRFGSTEQLRSAISADCRNRKQDGSQKRASHGVLW